MTQTKIKLNLDSLKSRREWKRHKVKDGTNVYRILPPFGEASNGYPYRKWQIIWGLTDPESGRARPFASSMTSEKRCPVTEYVAQLKERAEDMKAQFKASGVSEEDIKERMATFNTLINDLSPKTVYIYNAADKAGEVGLLELKSTAHKKMKTEMNNYIRDYNQDPTSLGSTDEDSGLWFNVLRSGIGRDTEYDVKKCQSRVKGATGGVSFVDDRSALPEAVVENYDNLAYDLSAVYQVKSYDELTEILNHNLENIYDLCPDADLTQAPNFTAAPVAATTRQTPAKPAGTKPIAINLADDEDDINEDNLQGAPVRNAATKAAPLPAGRKNQVPVIDDAFMAEADAILNG